ncbi:hypothetical protein CFAL_04735 [Corynebacterium falsenii DSM 44353]|uniref:hypothetical protein n=1 Tax=Corynebacterium falsenii TaxID=108486 RepID=UPI0003E94636|nr:hypothetical protein [Corynebacterium falsenii]AHI04270.1 hypothetical protein CFAL_04735 [Corynebacterium falsenii DSM 44353]UBI05809.1 hypothetical protein LA343_06635 [Corynebacterium falsenii]UBI07928.1 hypothetical protein LA329_08365 [Corynebacterium falsenii]
MIEEVFAEESLLGKADEQAEDGSGDNERAERAAQGEFDGGGGEGDDGGDCERAEGDAVALREGAGPFQRRGVRRPRSSNATNAAETSMKLMPRYCIFGSLYSTPNTVRMRAKPMAEMLAYMAVIVASLGST